jgi:hypothetical protein
MSDKPKNAFRFRTGFFFGVGFMTAAYVVMWFMEGAAQAGMLLFLIIMKGLGFGAMGI